MDLPLSAESVPLLIELEAVGSTNTELISRAGDEDLPSFATFVTANQTGGRGRLDRRWTAPSGTSLAISVLVRPRRDDGARLDPESLGWLPLLAGVAMSRAVAELVPESVELKWPNDVLIGGRKVSGILAELTPAGDIVIGSGLNTTMTIEQLPVATATSLVIEGAAVSGVEDRALAGYLQYLQRLLGRFFAAGGDAAAGGLARVVADSCATLGRRVRVELPGAAPVVGVAIELDDAGRLVVRQERNQRVITVAAGDVTHLRYE